MLVIPPEESLRRSDQKNEPFSETLEERYQRIELYYKLISEGRWQHVIDAQASKEDVFKTIENILVRFN
jgi:thymidylate kinase